jgi:hypothetical protein
MIYQDEATNMEFLMDNLNLIISAEKLLNPEIIVVAVAETYPKGMGF